MLITLRTPPSSPRAFALTLAAGLGLVLACSGPDDQAVLSGTLSKQTSSGGNTSGGNTSGGNTSGGNTSGEDPGGCASESEPNDNQNDANTIKGSICGSISPRGDRDWLTFTLAPSTQTLSLQFSGSVRLRVTVAGKGTTELTPDDAGQVPFVKNEPYYVEVAAFSDTEAALPWQISIVEK